VVQDAAVPCNCPTCGASLVVFPSSVPSQVGEKTASVEAELDFAGALAEYRDGTERRYPVADVDGDFTCPACQAQGNIDDVEPWI
jgi:rubredoxin